MTEGFDIPAGDAVQVHAGDLFTAAHRTGHVVPAAQSEAVVDALAHALGCGCANDVTAIGLIARDPTVAQWARARSFNEFCALGPVIETAFDAGSASLSTVVGGRGRRGRLALANRRHPSSRQMRGVHEWRLGALMPSYTTAETAMAPGQFAG